MTKQNQKTIEERIEKILIESKFRKKFGILQENWEPVLLKDNVKIKMDIPVGIIELEEEQMKELRDNLKTLFSTIIQEIVGEDEDENKAEWLDKVWRIRGRNKLRQEIREKARKLGIKI